MDRLTERFDGGIRVLSADGQAMEESKIFWGAIEKLAEYEDAEEQERLIKIPADYKDAVFSLDTMPHNHISQLEFYGMELTAIGTEDESRYIIAGKNGCTEYFNAEHIGKTIFFSREEAEARLKELQGMDAAVENVKHGKASEPVDLSDLKEDSND